MKKADRYHYELQKVQEKLQAARSKFYREPSPKKPSPDWGKRLPWLLVVLLLLLLLPLSVQAVRCRQKINPKTVSVAELEALLQQKRLEAALQREAEAARAEQERLEVEALARRLEAEAEAARQAEEARLQAEHRETAAEAAARQEELRRKQAAAKAEAQRRQAEAAARQAELLRQQAAAKAEAERKQAEAAARQAEIRRQQAAAKAEAERKQAEAAARQAEIRRQQAAAKAEAERKQAEAAAKELARLKTMPLDALNQLIEKEIDAKAWEAAQQHLDIALKRNPDYWRSNRNQGVVQLHRNELPAARQSYAAAVEDKGDEPNLWYEYGRILYSLQDYPMAAYAFDMAVKYQPHFRAAAFNSGLAYEKAGNPEKAAAAFQKTIQIEPKHSPSLYWLGELSNRSQAYDDAIRFLNQAIAIDPGQSAYFGTLGLAYFAKKEFAKAEKAFRQSLALDKSNAASNYNLANVLMDQQKMQEAYPYAVKAAQLNPTGDYCFKAGVVAQNIGNAAEAVRYFEKALSMGFHETLLYVNLGSLYNQQEDYAKAAELLSKAYEKDRNSKGICLNLANAYFHLEKYDLSRKYYQYFLQKEPDDVQAHYFLGVCMMKTRFYSGAIDEMMRTLQLDDHYYDAYYQLGTAYRLVGDTQSAVAVFKKLIAVNPDYPKYDEIVQIIEGQ